MRATSFYRPFWVGIAAFVLLASLQAHAQATPKKTAPAAPPPTNAALSAIQNVGIKTCAPAIERLSRLAIERTVGHDVLLDWDRKNANAAPVFLLIGLEYPDAGAALSLTAVPRDDGSCTVAAERISSAPVSCQMVAQSELQSMRATHLLPTFKVYTDPKDPTATVSLIDAPPGCLVIRRYVEYHWTPPR